MIPHVFRPGDKVRCAFYGDEVFTVASSVIDSARIILKEKGETDWFNYTGTSSHFHTHPVLTLVEAKKEPIRIECEVEWHQKLCGDWQYAVPLTDGVGMHTLIGKRGRLTFVESEEK